MHEDIGRVFPEYAHLTKWHLCSSDGPMHYVANTIFHASDKDCWGRRAGDPSGWDKVVRFGAGMPYKVASDGFFKWLSEQEYPREFDVVEVECGKDFKYKRYGYRSYVEAFDLKGYQYPFSALHDAESLAVALNTAPSLEFDRVPIAWSEGKEPDLDAARSCAIWPGATLEQLQDKDQLLARLPGIMAEFKGAMESLGFTY